MIITIEFFIMSLTLFIGAFKLLSAGVKEGFRRLSHIYGTFFISLAVYFFIMGLANSLPLNIELAQELIYLGLFIFLFSGLGFALLFTFLLLDRKILGYFTLFIIITVGVVLYLYRLNLSPDSILLFPGTFLAYRSPNFTNLEVIPSMAVIILSTSVYSVSLFRTLVKSTSRLVRQRSFLMAVGAILAGFGGLGYFGSHLLPVDIIPMSIAVSLISSITGFILMVVPIFLKERSSESVEK